MPPAIPTMPERREVIKTLRRIKRPKAKLMESLYHRMRAEKSPEIFCKILRTNSDNNEHV
jgi:hypothetical protein